MKEQGEEEGDVLCNACHVLKLSIFSNKYAAQITAHARAVKCHERKLVLLHARIKAEAVAIAGPEAVAIAGLRRAPHRLLRGEGLPR